MVNSYTIFIQAVKTAFIFTLLFILSCGEQENAHDAVILNGLTMGTTYTVKINQPGIQQQSLAIKQTIDQTLEDINTLMSTYIPDSELSTFNSSNSTDWFVVHDELFKVIDTGTDISYASDGAFDITIGPLVNLWGFGPVETANRIPDETAIRDALANVNYKQIHLDENTKAIKKDLPDMYLDLSGIAKGYAVDRIASLLEKKYSLNNYMVEIGGEIRTRGENPDGEKWRVAIEIPRTEERTAGQIINLDNMAMATSGDYRNYFEIDNIIYSHTINPKTGWPVAHHLKSVTVIHPECMVADAWSTALLVTGPGQGLKLADNLGLAAFFIIKDKEEFTYLASKKFRDHLSR